MVFLFTCGNFALIFTVFIRFFGSDFFLNVFPNPSIVHSRPSFLFEPNFHFSLVVFFHMRHFTLIICFFIFIWFFLEMVFPIHSKSVLGLVFCLVNENSLNCTSGLVLLCLFISSSRFLLRLYDVTITSNLLFVHSFMQFHLNCVLDVIFHSQWIDFFVDLRDLVFGHIWLTSLQKWLPHFEIDFCLL